MRAVAVVAVGILAAVLAGCLESAPPKNEAGTKLPVLPVLAPHMPLKLENTMAFTETVVKAAVGFAEDLYEPTMEVSKTGVIYVTGHTILVDTTGAPVFMSKDDGKTWSQLPFLASAKMPDPIHGATPPPSDEIFLVAGDDGWLYGVDITAVTFPVNAWKGNGAEHAYHNPNAYDRVSSTSSVCAAAGLNDRPWAAYAKGKLLMVNNPGGGQAPLGRVEIGVMDVPPAVPVGVGNPVNGAKWNYCATVGGDIPGIPAMRDDHSFAAPQVKGSALNVVIGKATDVSKVEVVKVFDNQDAGGGTMNGGYATFDANGTLFVGMRNNTFTRDGNRVTVTGGQLHLAASQDAGKTFVDRTYKLTSRATSIYLDGNMMGPGALLTWAQRNGTSTDWYTAHVTLGADGGPVVSNATLALANGPPPSAHVQGAAVGPDGRAYFVTFHPADNLVPGSLIYLGKPGATPLHVWVQKSGPTLPVFGDGKAAPAIKA